MTIQNRRLQPKIHAQFMSNVTSVQTVQLVRCSDRSVPTCGTPGELVNGTPGMIRPTGGATFRTEPPAEIDAKGKDVLLVYVNTCTPGKG